MHRIGFRRRILLVKRPPLATRITTAAGGAANITAMFLYGVNATVGGGTLSAWADANGGGATISQGTGSAQPADSGSDYVFDGVNDYLKGTFTFTAPLTIIAVVKQVTWTLNRGLMDGATLDTALLYQNPSTPNLKFESSTATAANSGLTVATYRVITGIINGASSSLRVNEGAPTTGTLTNAAAGGLTLGAYGNASNFANVAYKAVVLCPLALSASQAAAIRAELYGAYAGSGP